jgi:hypothetical protein
MLKEFDPPKERARNKAERKWCNNDVRKRVVEARRKPNLVDPNKEPEIAETVTNDGRRDGPIRRFENRFKKEIRTMMEGHAKQNLTFYLASRNALMERRRYLLLKEKLRRLMVAQRETDLFGFPREQQASMEEVHKL